MRNEHFQFELGNLLRFLSSQGDSEMGIPILAMKNSHRDYPIKQLKYLKGYSGEVIPRLKAVLSKSFAPDRNDCVPLATGAIKA